MPDVPQFKKPMPLPPENEVIYCFPPGTSEADKQHNIKQIEQFIEHIKATRRKRQQKRSR
jgi:hypothetical protein